MSYKSRHTGSEIDDTVDKVQTGDVITDNILVMSKQEYDNIVEKDPKKFYFIHEDETV